MASSDHWPADVMAAMDRLRLDHYSPLQARGVFAHLDTSAAVRGLANSVKGSVLEIRVKDDIDHGDALGLPGTPDHAELAANLSQPGWDVETFSHGHHVGFLQMKETAHWAPIGQHLAKYPDVP